MNLLLSLSSCPLSVRGTKIDTRKYHLGTETSFDWNLLIEVIQVNCFGNAADDYVGIANDGRLTWT